MIIERFANELLLYLTRQQGAAWSAIELEQAGTVHVSAQLPSSVSIPDWASEPAGEGMHALSLNAVNREIAARGEQARVELIAALGGLESVQVTWGDGNAFLGLTASTRGEIRLALADWLLGQGSRIAEFSVHSILTLQGNPALPAMQISSALCVALELNRPALLRVDLDDLNFSFPEFEFPNLGNTAALAWPDLAGSSRLLERFAAWVGGRVEVTLVAQPATPLLAIDLAGGMLRWALVQAEGPLDWTNIEPQLARFDVTFTTANGVAAITELKVANTGAGLWLTCQQPTFAHELLRGTVHTRRLGPLELRVAKVTLNLLWSQQHHCLLAEIAFEDLWIGLADDPQTFLALSGKVQITPASSRLVALKLVQPYSLTLLSNAGDVLLRGARNVVAFLASLEGPEATVPRLTRLLEILGRFASALAAAALVVGQALDALAEGILSLLGQLPNPFEVGAPRAVPLQLEVRIGLAPLQVRQVLVKHQTPLPGAQRRKAGGLELTLHPHWQPGLLLDLVDNPGAYLLLSHEQLNSSTALADLGTDLWLQGDGGVTHMPDAEEKDGQRADIRLITLKTSVAPRTPGERVDIVLVGVERGQAVFLKRLEGSLLGIAPGLARVEAQWHLTPANLKVEVDFAENRLLPLLGMGEPGISAAQPGKGDFLDKLKQSFAQVVWVKSFSSASRVSTKREVSGELILGLKAAGIESEVKLGLVLSLDTLRVHLGTPSGLGLKSRRIVEQALGLTWVIEQLDETARNNDTEVEMFTLSFRDGESGLRLNGQTARIELRFNGLSADDDGIVFKVSTFFVGRRGIDISATVDERPVRLNGLDVPFRFHQGRFEMRAGKLVQAAVSGRGTLPPALIGDAECTLDLAFSQDASGIVLQSGKVAIDKKGEAIVCHSTRFTLVITDLDLGIQLDGGYHLYLLVSGSLRFTPKAGEFEGGLLGFLKDIDITLERTPLTGDARVLARHVSFQKALTPKKSFSLFNLFTFELRGFGFHPSAERFDGAPAINLSGQIKFADIGDVMQPKIDFHGLWIAPAKDGEALPRISAEGLGLDLQLAGSVKVRGSVLAVDPSTRTVEGKEFAPAGYDTYGFLGEGEVEIPGWGAMQASLGFLEVEARNAPGARRKAFFVYLQKDKLAVEIPTGFWNFYMREAGMGFGFRYTLTGIRAADEAKTPAQLIRVLDDVSKRQGDLSRFAAWTPDPDGDRFTLALRAALQAYPAKKAWIEKEEETAQNPFFFDMIVALRSDLTLLASLRGWLGVNYADFRANKDNFRERPGLRGYLYISAPRSELLARMVGDSKGFIGERFEGLRTNEVLRRAVESVDWSATLFIRPGLFHYELGWPDQLAVRLVDSPDMKVSLRGGMIFRAAEDGLLWGYNIEADAWLKFGGSAGSGSIGVALEATLQARFVARLIAYLSWRFSGSMVYGLVMLDASLSFRVRAWMEVDLGFTSFTLRIGFPYSVQFSAAIEMVVGTVGVGGRGNARLAISAFGCTLGVGVGFAFNAGTLDAARAQVQRFLTLSISADRPDLPPAVAGEEGDKLVDAAAQAQTRKDAAQSTREPEKAPAQGATKPDRIYPQGAGRKIGKTAFWLVLHEDGANDGKAYGLLVPREASDQDDGGFYASPPCVGDPLSGFSYRLHYEGFGGFADVRRLDHNGGKMALKGEGDDVLSRWDSKIPVDTPDVEFRLDQLFDECFLTSTLWRKDSNDVLQRLARDRQEPKRPRQYLRQRAAAYRDEAGRAAQRDMAQREQAADAAQSPDDERVWQARSTAMSLFLDQFVTLASGTLRSHPDEAHVLDLGLVFHGPAEQLEALAKVLTVYKHDQSLPGPAPVEVFNPQGIWFRAQDPIFSGSRLVLGANGLCMAWDLRLPWLHSTDHDDPDQFLHHYEIRRTIEGREYQARTVRIKPAATLGATLGEKHEVVARIAVHPADWQYVDDFADLPADWRRALLPTSNEADALLATNAWSTLDLPGDVTFTYSITPVDIAGTRGLSKSFLHVFERPQPPVRAAEAEIRVVQTLRSAVAGQGWQSKGKTDRPEDLSVYIAVHDPAWQARKGTENKRFYTLIVEQERILPAGAYAAGGATDKVRGLGSAGAQAAGPTQRFEIAFDDLQPLSSADGAVMTRVRVLEPDEDTLKRFDHWGALTWESGWKKLLPDLQVLKNLVKALWTDQDGQRVAARFWLRTDIRHEGTLLSSKLVQVPCELTIAYPEAAPRNSDKGLLSVRPEVFEWPLHLRLPPLPQRQVRARSGFLHLRKPRSGASLGQWAGGKQDCIEVQRDSARRSAVHLEFDALPQWPATVVDPLHQSSIAGFDLHELDLDDLAPLDTEDKSLENSPDTWKRARRIAHIELLSAEEASLVPSSNVDWLGWQAHYPSESWRAQPRPGASHAAPRRAWYSARESTPHFAARLPRQRLLLQAPASAIIELLRKGVPDSITVKLAVIDQSPAWHTLAKQLQESNSPAPYTPDQLTEGLAIGLSTPSIEGADTATPEYFSTADAGDFSLLDKEQDFSASALRYLLLSLCLEGLDEREDVLKAWQLDPGALDGLNLELSAKVEGRQLANVQVTLDFRSPLHPLLEETLAELALHDRQGKGMPQVYRAYNVMLQAPPQVDARELSGWLAATPAASDPYGWGVLQALGLAATVRLYHLGEGRFLRPSEVAERVDRVFSAVFARWRKRLDGSCEPFAEVLLKPGADRVVRSFDALGASSTASHNFEIDDDGLAMIQLSLRPVPEKVWKYSLLTIDNVDDCKQALGDAQGRLQRVSLCLKRTTDDTLRETIETIETIELIDPASGYGVVLGGEDEQVRLQLPQLKLARHRLWQRYPAGHEGFAGVELFHELAVTTLDANGKPQQLTITVPILPCALEITLGKDEVEPDTDTPGIDVFELFPVQPAEAWAVQMNTEARRLATLLAHLRAVAPGFAAPKNEDNAWTALMAQYTAWTQRFLDYAAAPGLCLAVGSLVHLALAAPSKTNPLRLTADGAGCVRLYIPSDDRWGHARAYALRPVSRYAHLMASVGLLPAAERERLVTDDMRKQPIGHAIAVVPRTERIEPPVILGSSIQEGNWELLLARHGEESLAASNRPLFARLGKPDMLLTQLRAYRSPSWPEKFAKRFGIGMPELYPQYPAEPAQRPELTDEPHNLTAKRLSVMASALPGLWKGADALSVPAIAPHYKVLVVAAARAGIVVSELVSALQDDLPRRPLRAADDASPPTLAATLSLVRGSHGETLYRLDHRLLSHEDLTPEVARYPHNADTQDVRWWPDPDISYRLLYLIRGDTPQITEELSDTRLVAEDPDAAAVAVRCRGTRWSTAEQTPAIQRDNTSNTFSLTVDYRPLSAWRGTLSWDSNNMHNPEFEIAVVRFARVLRLNHRSFGLQRGPGETDAGYEARIVGFPGACGALAEKLKLDGRFDAGEVTADCTMAGSQVDNWLSRHGGTAGLATSFKKALDTGGELSGLNETALRYWPRDLEDWDPAPLRLWGADLPDVLGLWDIPLDSEIDRIVAIGHPLAQLGSPFWQLLVQRLTGGAGSLELRAVDARAQWPDEADPHHPGVLSVAMQWPRLVTMIK